MYEIFEQLLQKYNVTAYKVGKETGIPGSTFSAWKNGISNPKPDKLKKIADYFGVTVDYLMGNENNSKPNTELTDDELKRLQVLRLNDKIRVLFDEAQELQPSDIDFILEMVKKIKKG